MMMKKKGGDSKMNPYSSMGRDKFSALLSDLDAKRRTIMSEMDDPHEVSAIRFADTGSKLKPVVVRSATSFNKKMNVDNDDGMRVRRSRVRERKKEEIMDRDDREQRRRRDTEQADDDEEEDASSSLSLSKEEVDDDDDEQRKMKKEESKSSSCNKMMKLSKNKKKKRKIDQAGAGDFVYVGVMALVMVIILLLLVFLFERYWKIYYMIEFQARACQPIRR